MENKIKDKTSPDAETGEFTKTLRKKPFCPRPAPAEGRVVTKAPHSQETSTPEPCFQGKTKNTPPYFLLLRNPSPP